VAEAPASLGVVILAAGASSRLGQPKQLVEIDGQPLVRRQVEIALTIQPARVVVVTGGQASDVEQAIAGMGVDCCFNQHWEKGMGNSLAAGIRAMPERVRGAMLLLVDQWRIQPGDLDDLVTTWAKDPLAAVTACWGDTSGPPVIFPRSLFAPLSRLTGDRGARHLLKKFSGGLVKVQMDHAQFDLDSPQQLDALWAAGHEDRG